MFIAAARTSWEFRVAILSGLFGVKSAESAYGILNVAGFLDLSTVNGPGKRAVLWVQGCTLRCRDCFNSDLREFIPKKQKTIETLSEKILGLPEIEGVTFSGGEPFCQAQSLSILGGMIRKEGLNIVTFTGFPYHYIRKKDKPSWNALLDVTDLLVAGPFIPRLRCSAPMISSSNQQLVHLTGRLEGRVNECQDAGDITEFSISSGGVITTTGYTAGLLSGQSRPGISGEGR